MLFFSYVCVKVTTEDTKLFPNHKSIAKMSVYGDDINNHFIIYTRRDNIQVQLRFA